MDKEIHFSVIVPVYNVEPYLPKCIESVLEQSYSALELILIDDGSTDQSGLICDAFAQKDGRVRVIHQDNAGLSMARNKGMDCATGDYLIFLDSDDYWHDDQVLDKIALRLKRNGADVLSFNYVKFTDEAFEKPYFGTKESMPLDMPKEKTFTYQVENDLWLACAWNKVIKRALFADGTLSFRPKITSEDIDWCLRLALQADRFDFLADVVVCYRQRRTSISKSMTAEKLDMLLDNIELCLNLMEAAEEKANLLRPYLGYQYGTAVYLVASMHDSADYRRLFRRVNSWKHLLSWSNNRKIRMMRWICSIGGLNLVMMLLRLREKIRQGR